MDFFDNLDRALEPAHRGEVDAVVHAGDLLYRSKVPAALVEMAFEPLKKLAAEGVPVYLVPGNHERSAIPYRILAEHPLIHIFHKPCTFYLDIDGFTLALSGFPYERKNVRENFLNLIEQTNRHECRADAHIICIHHLVEGASVGPNNFVFRSKPDVIRPDQIPPDFAAVFSGHIHRFQVLTKDTNGRPFPASVFYPGSVERTSFAEMDEKKGFLIVDLETKGIKAGTIRDWKFHELPARPMEIINLEATGKNPDDFESEIKKRLAPLAPDSIVKLKVTGSIRSAHLAVLSASSLRSLAPKTMNLTASLPRDFHTKQ